MDLEAIWQRVYEYLAHRRWAYSIFRTPEGKAVLKDLAKFCRANASAIGPDDQSTYALNGRREVYLRIMQHTNLSTEELMEIYYSPPTPTVREGNG